MLQYCRGESRHRSGASAEELELVSLASCLEDNFMLNRQEMFSMRGNSRAEIDTSKMRNIYLVFSTLSDSRYAVSTKIFVLQFHEAGVIDCTSSWTTTGSCSQYEVLFYNYHFAMLA